MDTALDAVMLLMAARFEGRWIRPARLMAGALVGAAAAGMADAFALTQGQKALLWLPTAFGMALAVQGKRALMHPLKSVALLLCAAGLLGGTIAALAGAAGSLMKAYALGGVCIAGMTLCLTRTTRSACDLQSVRLLCRYRGRKAQFEAMVDSGNTLRDYLTHRPVIVVPEALGRRLFGLTDEPLRPIFADTAGGRQMMALLVPQETIVCLDGEHRRVDAAVALCAALGEGAPALVPASLLQNEIKA